MVWLCRSLAHRSFAILVSSVPCIVAASYSAPFSSAHFPCPPLILLPYRCHSPSPRAVIVLASSRSSVSFGEEHGGAMSSDYVGKQAGRVGDAIRIRSCPPSRRCVSWRSFFISSRSSSRASGPWGGAFPVVVRAIMWQAGRRGRVLVGYARSPRLCPFYEHQFDIWIPQGSHHPLGSPCLSPVN